MWPYTLWPYVFRVKNTDWSHEISHTSLYISLWVDHLQTKTLIFRSFHDLWSYSNLLPWMLVKVNSQLGHYTTFILLFVCYNYISDEIKKIIWMWIFAKLHQNRASVWLEFCSLTDRQTGRQIVMKIEPHHDFVKV